MLYATDRARSIFKTLAQEGKSAFKVKILGFG